MSHASGSIGHRIAAVIAATIRVVGSVPAAILAVAVVSYLAYTGSIGALAALAIGLLIGIPCGVVGTLKFIDYAITYWPESFLTEYKKRKDDGRWDSMLAKMNARWYGCKQ